VTRPGIAGAAILLGLAFLTIVGTGRADAHNIGSTALIFEITDRHVEATVQLPIDALGLAMEQQLTTTTVRQPATLASIGRYVLRHVTAVSRDGAPWKVSFNSGQVQSIDGTEQLVLDLTLQAPNNPGPEIIVTYDAIVHRVLNHNILVTVNNGNDATGTGTGATVLGVLDFSTHTITVPLGNTQHVTTSFRAAIKLGVHHIGSGTDHLLFLAMLLLPAPLRARRRRWTQTNDTGGSCRRVIHVVTAFTLGHSITLALAATGHIHAPSRVVESLIAVSILVSAIHAIHPLLQHGEPWIAGGFGLVHGLAFATLLSNLALTRGSLLTNLLGFNIGIELTQLIVVALIIPSLFILNPTPAYHYVRIGLAGSGIVLAIGWLAERTNLITRNPLNHLTDLSTQHPFELAGTFAAIALITRTATTRTAPQT
jgi:HupE / UreJ protein